MLRMELMCFIMMDGWATGKMMVVADDDVVVGLGWGWRGGWLAAVRMEPGRPTQPPIPLPVRLSQPQAWTSHKCELACLPGGTFCKHQLRSRPKSYNQLQSALNQDFNRKTTQSKPLEHQEGILWIPNSVNVLSCAKFIHKAKKNLKDTFAAGVTPRGDALNKRKLGQVNLIFLVSLFWYCLVLNWYYRSDPKWLT